MAGNATRVLDSLLAVTTLFSRDLERESARTGLSTARMHLLWTLHTTGPSTQRALAEALAVSPRNITGLVDALEGSGHVRRGAHPTDRRAVLVALTPTGAAAMTTMADDYEHLAAELVAGMAARDVAALADALAGVTERLQRAVEAADG